MTVTRDVQSAFWAGPVAVRFRTTWTERHCVRLASARELLREQARKLREQAQEQQDASTGGGGVGHREPDLPALPFGLGNCVVAPAGYDPALEAELASKLADGGAAAGWTQAQIDAAAQAIARHVADSPEPFKSLFYEHIGKVRFTHDTFLNGGFGITLGSDIHIDFNKFAGDAPVPYYTLFHEFGHAVDSMEDDRNFVNGVYLSQSFRSPSTGETLSQSLYHDVSDDIGKTLASIVPPGPDQQATIDAVRDAVMGHNVNFLQFRDRILNTNDSAIVEKLAEHYYNTAPSLGQPQGIFNGDDARVVSDVYGGVTWNVVRGRYAHTAPDWWDANRDGAPDFYWATFSFPPESEAWAGYFADQMTDPAQTAKSASTTLAMDKQYLSSTVKAMDEMAYQMTQNGCSAPRSPDGPPSGQPGQPGGDMGRSD